MIRQIFDLENTFSLCWRSKSYKSLRTSSATFDLLRQQKGRCLFNLNRKTYCFNWLQMSHFRFFFCLSFRDPLWFKLSHLGLYYIETSNSHVHIKCKRNVMFMNSCHSMFMLMHVGGVASDFQFFSESASHPLLAGLRPGGSSLFLLGKSDMSGQ